MGIMENKMETTIGFRVPGLRGLGFLEVRGTMLQGFGSIQMA